MKATDRGSGVSKIMFCDVTSQSSTATCDPTTTKTYVNLSTASWTQNYNIARVQTGYYKRLCAKAEDANGNESPLSCRTIYSNSGTTTNSTSSDTTKPVISSLRVGVVRETNKIKIITSLNETGSGVRSIAYCVTSSTSCTPIYPLRTFTSNFPKGSSLSYTENIDYQAGGLICVQVTDANYNKSDKECTQVLNR